MDDHSSLQNNDPEVSNGSPPVNAPAVSDAVANGASRLAAAQRIQERIGNGEIPAVAEFEAAGINMTDEHRRILMQQAAVSGLTPKSPSMVAESNSEDPPAQAGNSEIANSTKETPAALAEAFPDVVPAWADVKDSLRLPVPRIIADDSVPVFSGLRPQFMQYKRSLFEVNTGREIAKLPAEFSSDQALVNNDGRYVVRFKDSLGAGIPAIYVHRAQNPAEVLRLECSRYHSVDYIQLLTSRLIFVFGDTKSGERWTIWDLEDGKEVSSFNTGDGSGSQAYCVNPAGSRFAMWTYTDGVRIYNLSNGQIEGQLEPPRSSPAGRFSIQSLSFSPDGKEIAAVLYPSQIAVWSSDGKLLQQELVPRTGYGISGDEAGLSWLPDGSGWFVGGRMLVDRKTSSVIWEIVRNRSDSGRQMVSRVLSNDQVLVMRGDDEAREMMPVRIPWDKIRDKLKLIRTDEPVDLKPGATISLQTEVGEVRSASREEVDSALKASVAKILQISGLSEAADQPVRLVLRHVEAVEADRIRNGLFSILAGPSQANGQAKDTKVTIAVELQNRTTGEVYWKTIVESSGAFHVRGEVTEQSLRAAAFQQTLEELERTLLPTRLFPGSRDGLPVQSMIP